jgi:hypothetical protein
VCPAGCFVAGGGRLPPGARGQARSGTVGGGRSVGQVVRPRPAGSDAQDVSPSVADEDAGGVEQATAANQRNTDALGIRDAEPDPGDEDDDDTEHAS